MSSSIFIDSTFSGFSNCLDFEGAICRMIRAISASFEISVAFVCFTTQQLASVFQSISVFKGCFCIIGSVFHNHGLAVSALLPNQLIFDADF